MNHLIAEFCKTVLDILGHPTEENNQGPVVQSIVSLTSPLRRQLVDTFTTS